MTLTYDAFKYTSGVSNIVKTGKVVKLADKGEHVNLLKAALVDLGYKLPIKTKSNQFDENYTHEMVKVVTQFQTDHKLTASGKVDAKTVLKMDKLLTQKYKKKNVTVKTQKPVSPTSGNAYMIGTADPQLWPDKGAGAFDSDKVELVVSAKAGAIKKYLNNIATRQIIKRVTGPNAVKHLQHYFKRLGTEYKIDLEGMIKASTHGQERFKEEVVAAKKFCETLPDGKHSIAATKAKTGFNRKHNTKDWHYAVGDYRSWGKGVVTVSKEFNLITLDFEYHMYDRYNWDSEPGMEKFVIINGNKVTDKSMGAFHRQGLAKEFNMRGMVKRHFSWTIGEAVPQAQYNSIPSNRLIHAH